MGQADFLIVLGSLLASWLVGMWQGYLLGSTKKITRSEAARVLSKASRARRGGVTPGKRGIGMISCLCSPAPAPFDHLLESHPRCLAHNGDVRLVSAGWRRVGDYWELPPTRALWTKEQALEVLNDRGTALPKD